MKRIVCAALAVLLAVFACAALAQMPRKVVYLTFDDGPKADTPELLEILKRENVPATFFFVGQKVRTFPQEARMVYDAGYAIGCHSVYHSVSSLKTHNDTVSRDYIGFLKIMREYVDPAFETDLYRFPGGSTGYKPKMRDAIVEAGCAWFDWNAQTSDTDGSKNAKELYEKAVKTTGDQEVVILLAHEGIKRTRWMLPDLIAFYRENGYEFRALSTRAEDREIYERCSARMKLPPMADEQEESL
ncbi:MAG: polysaccharide deacetylase family protein [Clostridia bacterium]|nr:polysaccharide deacetylase family protein [Clostridia bacterium]